MDCFGLVNAISNYVNNYYKGVGEGISNASNAIVDNAVNLVTDFSGTVGNAVENHINLISNPAAVTFETTQIMGEINPALGTALELAEASVSDNPANALGNMHGEELVNKSVVGASVAVPEVVSKALKVKTPTEAYNRRKHYGNTPTKADRKALGAKKDQDVDHTIPLVKHYYEKGGHKMTRAQRIKFAKKRANMKVKERSINRSDGGLSLYSKAMKQRYGLK